MSFRKIGLPRPSRKHGRGLSLESLERRDLLAADLPLLAPALDPMNGVDRPGAPVDVSPLEAGPRPDANQGPPTAQNRPGPENETAGASSEYSIDGTGNNAANPEWGSAGEQLLRLTTAEYGDGISSPAGEDRPSAREVSNTVAAQDESILNSGHLTDLTWLFGQFIDHDIDLTENATDDEGYPLESMAIDVPTGDAYFDPAATGDATIGFNRSLYDESAGADDARQQINEITAFLDGSVIYGSDAERAAELRTFEEGKLKTSDGDLLPFNEAGLANAGGTSDSLFLAGDIRANENAALSAMHTVWVREHNNWADQIAAEDSALTDEEIYQQARSMVIAELQAITFNEFLPALLGQDAIDAYQGYDENVNSGIANVFSTAAYRFGHSMLSTELLRLNNDGGVAAEGNLSLSDAFFSPGELVDNGIDSILLGAATQRAQEIDNQVVDDIRNFLFGPPGAGGFDLASLNIQRGRDHGLADYNQTRVDYGLAPVQDFSEITSDADLAAKLEQLYGDVDDIDVWVGGLAEDHQAGSNLGELFTTIIADQFERIRDGDANWHQNAFSGRQLAEIEGTSLADVIQRNTEITDLRDNVFYEESVLYFHADGDQAADVALVVTGDQVELVDRQSGLLLESRSIDDVSQVHLVGSRSPDQFTVDLRQAEAGVGEGIVIHGGDNDRNSITILGSDQTDDVVVDGNRVVVNDTTIDYSNVNLVRWQSSPNDDNLEVVSAGEARFVVESGRPQRNAGPQRNGGPQGGAGLAADGQQGDDQRNGGRRDRRQTPQVQPNTETSPLDQFFAELGEATTNPFRGRLQ